MQQFYCSASDMLFCCGMRAFFIAGNKIDKVKTRRKIFLNGAAKSSGDPSGLLKRKEQ
jgi:hypothetical protein